MTLSNDHPADLSGTADDRLRQLAELESIDLPGSWLRRQLHAALSAWADDETRLDIDEEARTDY